MFRFLTIITLVLLAKLASAGVLPNGNPEDQFQFGLTKALSDDLETAEKAFIEFSKLYPEHERSADALYWLGRVQFLGGKFDKSAITLSKFNKYFKNDVRVVDTTLWIAESVSHFAPPKQACEIFNKLQIFWQSPPAEHLSRLKKLKINAGCALATDEEATSEKGVLQAKSQGSKFCSDADFKKAKLSGDRYSPEEAYHFGRKIQELIRTKNLVGIFSLVKGELSSGPRKGYVVDKSFNQIFDKSWVDRVLSTEPECSPIGWRGFMLGNGLVWFNKSNNGWKITSLNGTISETRNIETKGWRVNNRVLHPSCFTRSWLSSDNFEEFGANYNIRLQDLESVPGQFMGTNITDYAPIKPTWCSKNESCEEISLVQQVQKCSPINFSFEIVDKAIQVKNSSGLAFEYSLMGQLSKSACESLAPNVGEDCMASYLVEISENTGGSMGHRNTYGIFGLFDLAQNGPSIVPLMYFQGKNEGLDFFDRVSKEPVVLTQDVLAPKIYDLVAKTNDKQGIIIGRVTDDTGIAELTIDGKIVQVQPDGRFEHRTFVPADGKQVLIEATDLAGLTSQKQLSLSREAVIQSASISFDSLNPIGKRVTKNRNALALIVGVASYENTPAPAIYADSDAKMFRDYASEKLGIPENRIETLINDGAELTDMLLSVKNWLARSVKQDRTDVYVFFAGHGLASDDGKKMYLLPYDGSPQLLDRTAILRDELFSDIAAANPRSVTVFLDTCYSGTTRGTDMLIASRPIAIQVKQQNIPDGFTVFTAAGGDQTAKPLEEAKHGMFSYFLMKGMEGDADNNGDNQITAAELHQYVEQNVVQQSGGSQVPGLQGDAERVLVRFQ